MGRMMPEDCPHGVTIDWGDFGPCRDCDEHGDDECPNLEPCPQCEAERTEQHVTPKGMDEARKRIENVLGRTINLVAPTLDGDQVSDHARELLRAAEAYRVAVEELNAGKRFGVTAVLDAERRLHEAAVAER